MSTQDEHTGSRVAALLGELRALDAPHSPLPCAHAAVVADASGGTHRGVTIRRATPSLGACAARVALARARAQGDPNVTLVVAVSDTERPALCGLCRQTILELAGRARVFVAGRRGAAIEASVLLPDAFRALDREEKP